jgi:hypothetical protein
VTNFPFGTESSITDDSLEWKVRAEYGTGRIAEFDAPLADVDHYFDNAETAGWDVRIERKTGDIHVRNIGGTPGHDRWYTFARKGRRRPVAARQIENLAGLSRQSFLRIVRTPAGGVRLFGLGFGLTCPQSDALRDKGWVRIADDRPIITSIGWWVIDHANDARDCLRRGMDLHAHQGLTTANGPRCRTCRAPIVDGSPTPEQGPERH